MSAESQSGWPDEDVWDEEPGPEGELLDRAWTALDEGDSARALSLLTELDPDWPGRWIPEALARRDQGDLSAARALLDRAREHGVEEDDFDYLWAEAELQLSEWKVDEASTTLEKLVALESNAAVLERLALCADLRGDFDGADRFLADRARRDPASPSPARLSPEEFEGVVATAVDRLPKNFRQSLETTEIVVEPVPATWMIDAAEPANTPPDLLGLFVGLSDLERGELADDLLPRRIFLFQRNLERSARSHDELVEEIRVTLYHEIGHMLGFDEEGVAAMGLE